MYVVGDRTRLCAICGHGGPLKTLEDIDDLTKGIELGKYEVWLGMTSDKRKEVTDTLFAMWDVVNPISSKPNSYANVTSGASVVINKHDATSIKPPIKLTKPVVILGVSIASKEELIRLVNKIELSALDDVISGLTTAEHQAAHALVLELARGFDYVNSKSDTSKDGLSIIASQIGMPIMLDSYTSSICIESWGESSFARCLIEINAGDVLKESLTMGVPLIEDSGFTIETVNTEYEWKPPRCDLCKIFGHVQDHCPKKVSITSFVDNLIVEKINDGFQTVGREEEG
ncbi:zinc knuckle CX2CX4HX4C containing protein [Tanacetum coccineum]